MGLPDWLCARRRPSPTTSDVSRSLRALAANRSMALDSKTEVHILGQVELALYRELLDINMGFESTEMNDCTDCKTSIKSIRGIMPRLNADVSQIVGEVVTLEQEVRELAKAAVAKPIAEILAVKDELNSVINELKDVTNGGPGGPLPGESQSMPSGGSTENPT